MPRKQTARRRDTPRRQVQRNVIQQSQAALESSFEDAFGHVDPYAEAEESIGEEPPIPVIYTIVGNEDTINEGETNIVDNESASGGDNDHDVGFGNADYFDVNDILELSDTVELSSDIIKDLKDNCISKIRNLLTLVLLFLLFFMSINLTGHYFIKVEYKL